MPEPLIIFPTPLDASCLLTLDNGLVLVGVPHVHPTGRPGVAFFYPEGTPNGNGSTLDITAPNYVPLHQRGILWLAPHTYLEMDDFHLAELPPPPVHTGRTGIVRLV